MDKILIRVDLPADPTAVEWIGDMGVVVTTWDGKISFVGHHALTVECLATVDTACLDLAAVGGASSSSFVTGTVGGEVLHVVPGESNPQLIGCHDSGVRCVSSIDGSMIATGSWDCSVRVWDIRSKPDPVLSLSLEERVYCMDTHENMLTVGTAKIGQVLVYDVRSMQVPLYVPELKTSYQARSVAMFTVGDPGFYLSSIGGRVMIKYLIDDSNSFTYKCHRENNNAYSVNCIATNSLGSFATTGGDGGTATWDKDSRQRLRQLPKVDNKAGISAAFCFSDPRGLAVVYGDDYSAGKPVETMPELVVYNLDDGDVRLKGRR